MRNQRDRLFNQGTAHLGDAFLGATPETVARKEETDVETGETPIKKHEVKKKEFGQYSRRNGD